MIACYTLCAVLARIDFLEKSERQKGETLCYVAWVENVGANYNNNVFSINCGDSMLAEVGAGDCMYIADFTSGSTSGWRCVSPNANTSTAECIVERPTDNGVVTNLSDYGTETFTHCEVEESAGASVGIGTVPHDYFN